MADEDRKKYNTRRSSDMMEKDDFINILNEKLKSHKEELMHDLKEMVRSEMNEIANHIFQRVDDLERKLNNALTTFDNTEKKISSMEEKIENVKTENKILKEKLFNAEKRIDDMEELTEDRTNRQMRKTLIFTNVRETEKESQDATDTLASMIAKASRNDINKEDAAKMIERAHRGKPGKKSKEGPRPIYAAIDDWRHSEKIKAIFFDKKNDTGIYCDQMYGPRTTWRRSQALKTRKELKANNVIRNGYVAYPAKLMIKKNGDDRYSMYKDFYHIPVTFGK